MYNLLHDISTYGDAEALRSLNCQSSIGISFRSYLDRVNACAANLQKVLGDVEGRHIGIFCESNYEYTIILAALLFSRAVVVPLNTLESTDNIDYIISDVQIEAVIVATHLADKINASVQKIDKNQILSVNEDALELADFTDDEKDKDLLIIYTSGTTGRPKGVVLTVDNIFHEKRQFINEQYTDGNGTIEGLRIYCNFPFYHVAGINAWIATMCNGASLYLSENYKNMLDDLISEKIDIGFVTPATLKLWTKAIKRGKVERLGGLSRVISAGAKIDGELIQTYSDNGITFGQFYGMTETGGNITSNFDNGKHYDSVGIPISGVDIKIIDGEICVKGWQIMNRYFNNPEDTNAILIDGYLHTGDLGYIDESGFVYITGRRKNLIILSSGENVSPEELERYLYKCEDVIECKVYENNDRIIAGVYAHQDSWDGIQNFVNGLNKTLPIYKRIYKIEFSEEEFEKTASGKIKR